MLSRLHIESFALIEKAEIEFGPGLNVITGETGAGKSILLGALNSILGATASADLVRTGDERSTVEGLFELAEGSRAIAALEDVDLEDGELILRREIRTSGRSRASANGVSLPLKKLQTLGSSLVDLHGQHEHQSLLDIALHRHFLDETAGLTELAQQVAEAFESHRAAERKRLELENEQASLDKESELRQFQLEEIRRIAPQEGEEEALEAEVRVLENQASLVDTAQQLCDVLYEGESCIVDELGRARRALGQMADTDPSLAPCTERIDEYIAGVSDLASSLATYARGLEGDPERLAWVRERLEALRLLRRKYGCTAADVLSLADDLERSEEHSESLRRKIDKAESWYEEATAQLTDLCLQLSTRRNQACEPLARNVEKRLLSLGMSHAAFEVRLRRTEDPEGVVVDDGRRFIADEGGLENVEFFVSANPGEELRPLARIASGGEISRIMLVLKEIIADRDLVSTLVFDEIDAGISGRVATAVGKRLQQLARSHQLIVITHLPQIASVADHHLAVRKQIRNGRALTEVCLLEGSERADEIANLLGGESVSTTARKHAAEMLK